MNAIRPLVTITILVVVGAYLYVKINEGAVQPTPLAGDAWNQPADGVPPLATSNLAPTTSDGEAPAWPNTSAEPAPLAAAPPAASADNDQAPASTQANSTAGATTPAIPAIPDIPDLGTTTQADTPADPTTPPVTEPANTTAAAPPSRYSDVPGSITPNAQPDASVSTVPSAVAPPAIVSPGTTLPGAPSSTSAEAAATTPEEMNAAAPSVGTVNTQPLTSQTNPLRQATEDPATAGRYGASAATTPVEPIATTPVTTPTTKQSFTEAWPAVQAALDRGELAEAHKLLSPWHNDPSLTPTDAERVDSLLSQLAGTVVYSTEHRLGPAHTVKSGETLETIAQQYNVPWQLLAKINSIGAPDLVRPGQVLKVVRGPFNAVVNLEHNELTLMLDDRYAGKFPVTVPPGQTLNDGPWVVDHKIGEPGVQNPPITVRQFISGERAIVLRAEAVAAGAAPASALVISSAAPAPGPTNSGTTIQVSENDAEELSDILSVGSRIIIRR